jgi:hypothetical protein
MGRLRCLLLAGALAVAVAAIAAGPAAAAKGGNSANAHACQHGGHKTLFEAETGDTFKNAGDCASHGARGGTLGQFAGQAACVQVGGRFALAPGVQNGVWQCVSFPVPPNAQRPDALLNACELDAGLGANLVSIPANEQETAFTAVCFNG